jgi:hypothetical protein
VMYDELHRAGVLRQAAIILQEERKERVADLIETGTPAHIAQSEAMTEIMIEDNPQMPDQEIRSLEEQLAQTMMPDLESQLSSPTTF